MHIFNVREFGATGQKAQEAQSAIQRAIDACAAAGGGMIYFPPGAYTSGTLHLRSHTRLFVEAGATIFSSKNTEAFDKRALFYGEDLEHLTIEGRGTIDGQGEYEWRLNDHDDRYILPNQRRMGSTRMAARMSASRIVRSTPGMMPWSSTRRTSMARRCRVRTSPSPTAA